jgi:hypothetical protein
VQSNDRDPNHRLGPGTYCIDIGTTNDGSREFLTDNGDVAIGNTYGDQPYTFPVGDGNVHRI